MKKLFTLLTILLVASMVLAACGATEEAEQPTPTQETAPEPTKAVPEPTKVVAEPTTPPEEGVTCEDEWGCVEFAAGESVEIAYVGPMTGPYSAFGIDISRGAELAIKDQPELKGFPIELVIEDTQGSPEEGAAVANKLAADDKLIGVAGHTFSGSTEAAIPVYEDAGLVMVSPSTTLVDLPLKGPNVYNRVAFSDGDQGRLAAQFIYNTLGIRNVVLMHDGGAYGQGLVTVMGDVFTGLGGTVLSTEAITPGETDYSAQLANISALSPELIYYGGYDADAAVIVSQMAAAGLGGTLFFGCDGTYGANYLDLAGSASEGTFSTFVPIPPSDAFAAFQAAYEADYGDPQGKLSPFSPHGYDAVSVLIAAADQVAIESDGMLYVPRKALALAVRSLSGFTGLTGTLTNDGTGNLAAAEPIFMIVQGGEWVEAAGMPTEEGPFVCDDEWGCVEIAAGQTVQIAYVGPMTGPYSAFGIDISRGAELAVKDNPEIMGFAFELVIEDTQGSPEEGAAVANKLAAQERLVGVAGHTFSGSTEAAIPVYEDAGLVMVSPSTTLVDLPLKGPNVYNRVAFSDGDQGRLAAQYIYNVLGIQNVVLMHDGGAYGQGLVTVMGDVFTGLGGTVLSIEAITPGETDYSAQLANISAFSPELIYYGGYDADAAVIVSQMAAAGLGGTLFFGCDGTYGANYLDLAGSASEGTYSTFVPIPPSDAFAAFQTAYEADYGDPQGKLSPFSPHGYDAVTVIIKSVEEVAVVSDGTLFVPRHALALAVRSLSGFTGLTGTLTNDGTGNLAAAEPIFMIVEGGEWIQAPGQ